MDAITTSESGDTLDQAVFQHLLSHCLIAVPLQNLFFLMLSIKYFLVMFLSFYNVSQILHTLKVKLWTKLVRVMDTTGFWAEAASANERYVAMIEATLILALEFQHS